MTGREHTAGHVAVPLPVLIFDGDCAFCTSSVQLGAKVFRRWPRAVPWQQADLAALGLDEARAAAAVQWVGPDGEQAEGAAAVAALLIWRGGPFGPLGHGLALPGIRALAARTYRWVADHRGQLPGGTPACALPASPQQLPKQGSTRAGR